MTQQTLRFKRPTRGEQLVELNIEAARIVLEKPELYGRGLTEWAKQYLEARGQA